MHPMGGNCQMKEEIGKNILGKNDSGKQTVSNGSVEKQTLIVISHFNWNIYCLSI